MKNSKIVCIMLAVMIIASIIGFTSCKDKGKEPDPDQDISSKDILGKWTKWNAGAGVDPMHFLEFKTDGTYSYVAKNETINGIYKITEQEKEKGTYTVLVYNPELEANQPGTIYHRILYKMLVSGSNVYDRLWVYYQSAGITNPANIYVQLYSGNELIQNLMFFEKQD